MCHYPIDYYEIDSLYHQFRSKNSQIFGITSSVVGEGVTSVIKSIAYRAATYEQSVLIVDLNCYNPELSRRTEFIEWGDAQPYKKNIDLIAVPNNATSKDWQLEIKNIDKFKKLIKVWKKKYQIILIDTSALTKINKHNIPAEYILSLCDEVYIIVKAGKTKKTELYDGLSILKNAGVKLTGTIYNDQVNPSLSSELIRETHRLDNFFPKISKWFREKIQKSHFLNMTL